VAWARGGHFHVAQRVVAGWYRRHLPVGSRGSELGWAPSTVRGRGRSGCPAGTGGSDQALAGTGGGLAATGGSGLGRGQWWSSATRAVACWGSDAARGCYCLYRDRRGLRGARPDGNLPGPSEAAPMELCPGVRPCGRPDPTETRVAQPARESRSEPGECAGDATAESLAVGAVCRHAGRRWHVLRRNVLRLAPDCGEHGTRANLTGFPRLRHSYELCAGCDGKPTATAALRPGRASAWPVRMAACP